MKVEILYPEWCPNSWTRSGIRAGSRAVLGQREVERYPRAIEIGTTKKRSHPKRSSYIEKQFLKRCRVPFETCSCATALLIGGPYVWCLGQSWFTSVVLEYCLFSIPFTLKSVLVWVINDMIALSSRLTCLKKK